MPIRLFVVLALILGLGGSARADAPAASPLADQPASLTTAFTYTAVVPAPPAGTKALNLWLPVPSNSVWQTVSGLAVQSPVPYKITREKKYGDRMVYVHETRPTGPLTVTVRFTVARRAVRVLRSNGAAPADVSLKPVLSADSKVPVGGRFAAIARQMTAGAATDLARERALFDSVVANMTYDYHHQSPKYAQGDAVFVCDYKSGNCSDLHSYLIALSRSLGIPAELEFGFPLTGIPISEPVPTDGTITGYHCWVWFQDPKTGWTPLDAADARRWQDAGQSQVRDDLFGNLVLYRSAAAVSRGRDITLSPPQHGAPLNYFIYPYAEANGQTVNATWTLTYHIDAVGAP